MAMVTESAASNRSLQRLRLPMDDVLDTEKQITNVTSNYFIQLQMVILKQLTPQIIFNTEIHLQKCFCNYYA